MKSLLALALSKPPQEREAFLNSVCAGDPALRRDIDTYLGHGEKTDQFIYNAKTVPSAHISFENPSAQATVQIPADPRIGRQFGKYIIRSRVAEGGMGIVYLALDTQLGREVALKVLPEYFSMDRERLSRFHREARATSLLNHPNIVTVFEIGQIEGCEYIVTEFVEGRTLRELMRNGQVPFVEMLKIGSQVAGALAAAHKAGIVHRDIKPENVMIRPDGYVKVLDFGLAKLSDATRDSSLGRTDQFESGINRTTPGMIMGTVSYMSPEQAEGLETDARTDIWALGVILYEMVSGKVPFSGPTDSHTIVAILERDPEGLQHASPELKQLITTALQKDRALRFQTADAMAGAIDELKHRLGYVSDQSFSGPAPEAKGMTIDQPDGGRSPYRRLLWLIPAAAIVLIAGSLGIYAVAAWLINTSRNGPVPPPVNTPSPTVEPTVEMPIIVDPTPTPPVVYVEPTPKIEREAPKVAVDEPRRRVERERAPEPARTPEPRPKRTPAKKPKPTQDPNCIFTNSCK
ncbi:MAG: protein kinase [Pyrinomonadaceae bacterium]